MGLLRLGMYIFSLSSCLVSALDNKPIILQIKSENSSYCRPTGDNEGPLGSYNLSQVPQFGALCNVPPPNPEQLKILLETNATPILCMGLYDVFQRFCKFASNRPILDKLGDQFPLTVGETNTLFDSFDKSDSFSSLKRFCSSTVKNNTITQSASVDTELWWSELNGQIENEKFCLGICRSNEEDKVNPLCSFIIWFNKLYLNFEKGFNEHKTKTEVVPEENQKRLSKSNLNKDVAIDSNQIWHSTIQNQSTLSSTMSSVVSTSTTLQHGQPSPLQEFQVLEANRSNQLQLTIPSHQTILANANIQKSNPSQSVPLLTPQIMTLDVKNKTETILNHKPVLKNKQVNIITVKEPLTTDSTNNPSILQNVDDSNVRIKDGLSTPEVTKPVDGARKTPEKHPYGMVESDYTLIGTPDGMEIEQPSLADKDLQQPYSVDEELENGDGDDIDFEPEGSAKLTQNKTTPNKSKSSSATVDQGVNDPDKAYGEEREVLIEDHFIEAEDSHFFTYFLCMAVLTIIAYLAFHNKKKLLALALEGKRTRGSRRRPNSSNYSKLDCSLEEAMSSSHTPASVTHVLY